jgi:hypothetical protein
MTLRIAIADRRTAGRLTRTKEFVQLQLSHDMQPWFLCRCPFTMAANIYGLHPFCRWMIKKLESCYRLTRLALSHIMEAVDDWVGTFGTNRLFIPMSPPSKSNQLICISILSGLCCTTICLLGARLCGSLR